MRNLNMKFHNSQLVTYRRDWSEVMFLNNLNGVMYYLMIFLNRKIYLNLS